MDSRTHFGLRWLALGLVMAVAIFAAACAGDETAKVSEGTLAPADQQVLRVRLTGEPRSIDPHVISQAAETTLTKPLFGGLFTYDPELRVIPSLASELPTDDN